MRCWINHGRFFSPASANAAIAIPTTQPMTAPQGALKFGSSFAATMPMIEKRAALNIQSNGRDMNRPGSRNC